MKIKTSLAAAMLILWTACGGSIAERTNKALSTALTATNAARDQFTQWDKQHQLDIVDKASTREEAEGGLKEYREKRQKIIQAFTVAYTSMASAAAMVPLVQAGEKKDRDLIMLLANSVEAVQSVIASVKEIREAFDAAPSAPKPEPDRPPNAEPAGPTAPAPEAPAAAGAGG
jgi:hypothetical protein